MPSGSIKIIVGIGLVFGIIFAYTQEISHWQNTLNLQKMLISAALLGAIIGSILAYFLGKNRRETLERFQIFVAVVMLSILLMPLLLSWTNRVFAYRSPQTESLELLRMEGYSGSRFGQLEEMQNQVDGYRIFVLRNGEIIRLQYSKIPFPGKQKGDQVPITIQRGLWGFEFVDW